MRIQSVCVVVLLAASAPLSWASPPRFQGLGDLPGGVYGSYPEAISGDGRVVVGCSPSGNSSVEAFRWTSEGGMQGLADLPGGEFYSWAYDVSSDGSVVVGYSRSGRNEPLHGEAFRWTAGTGMVGLGGLLPGAAIDSTGYGVSDDGSVVVGFSQSASGEEAFRWTSEAGMRGLGDLPGGGFQSCARGISGDGTTVVGTSAEGFRWTEAQGMVGIGGLPGGDLQNPLSLATDASQDGAVIVGNAPLSGDQQAFRWTEEAGMVNLGLLPGTYYSCACGVSADGAVVVGWCNRTDGSGGKAFIWNAVDGMRDVSDVLTSDCSLDLAGWTLWRATDVSADGTTIAGWGRNPAGHAEAWIATIPEPATLGLLAAGLGALLARRRKAWARAVTKAAVVAALVLLAAADMARADFILSGTEHQDVSLSHTTGVLWNSSTADVWQGGYIMDAYLNDDARLRILEWRFGTYGNSVQSLYAYDTSSVGIIRGAVYFLYAYGASSIDVSGGTAGYYGLYAYDTSSVDISGGVVGNLYAHDSSRVRVCGGKVGISWSNILAAYDTSNVDISGGRIEAIAAYETSSVTLHGYDFQATGGLSLAGSEVLGTGLLTGKWFDGTAWVISISSHDPGATILAVPEPLSSSLLALGGLVVLRRRAR